MGGEGDGLQENDVPASTILTRLQKLLWVEPAEAQPKASPLFSHNPPIERMRYLTELTRHYGTEFEDKAAEMGEYASKQVALSNVKLTPRLPTWQITCPPSSAHPRAMRWSRTVWRVRLPPPI